MNPFDVEHRLPGWVLAWARLIARPGAQEAAARARAAVGLRARRRFAEGLTSDPVVAEVRRLFRAAGADPTRYRPSSEALLRRLLRGEELPVIHPLVDLNNCLSVELAVPSCVMRAGSTSGRLRLRRGAAGERMESLRGDFDLADKPLVEDESGPFGTPITDSRRVAVSEDTTEAWLVAYLPAGGIAPGEVWRVLKGLDDVAQVEERFVTGARGEGGGGDDRGPQGDRVS